MRLRTFGGLWIESVQPLPPLGARRMAVLAMVASAGTRGISRERVAGILWGDFPDADARHTLSQNLYSIRRDTGADWIATGPRLSLTNGATSDIGDFVEAVTALDHRRVAELYEGSFLADFQLSGAPEFERWVDEERATHRRAALRALEALADHAPNGEGVRWWRRLTELDELNGQYAAGLIRALGSSGDLVAALAHARAHEVVVRRELEADVDPVVRKLVAELRPAAQADGLIGGWPEDSTETEPRPLAVIPSSSGKPVRRFRVPSVAAAILGLLAVTVLFDPHPPASLPGETVPAVGKPDANAPPGSVESRRSASPAAYALYQRGLQAFYRGDAFTAHTLMRAAYESDTGFAMAAVHGWWASQYTRKRDDALLEAARRLGSRASDQERLLIASTVSRSDSSILTSVAIAETLAARYPEDPESHVALGTALELLGDFPRSIAVLERVVTIDSAAGTATGPSCRLCGALYLMSRAYGWSDSLEGALRTARRLRALQPEDAGGWAAMAEALLRLERRSEAIAVLDSSEARTIPTDQPRELVRRDLIRRGDFGAVDRQLRADLAHPSAEVRRSAGWLLLLSLRNQGRLREATALARERNEGTHLAWLPMEEGNPTETARRFRSVTEERLATAAPPGVRARAVTWSMTLAATALAEAGDTAEVRRLADSVERIGRESNFGRDLRLHHFLRGLVHQRGGRHADAVEEFRLAVHSLSDGYTRINHEMARCLMQLGRPAEAIAVLQPALRGGVDGSNTYMTFTQLHETIARAFEQAGSGDSARAHWAAVERAWRHADPAFSSRYATARARAAGT